MKKLFLSLIIIGTLTTLSGCGYNAACDGCGVSTCCANSCCGSDVW